MSDPSVPPTTPERIAEIRRKAAGEQPGCCYCVRDDIRLVLTTLDAATKERDELADWKEDALGSFEGWHALGDALLVLAPARIGTYIPDHLKAEIPKLFRVVAAERDAAVARAEALERKLADEERAHMATLEERDNFHDAADKLAYAIAPLEVIGEHSTMNDPWANALDEIEMLRDRAEAWAVLNKARELDEQKVARLEAELSRLRAQTGKT